MLSVRVSDISGDSMKKTVTASMVKTAMLILMDRFIFGCEMLDGRMTFLPAIMNLYTQLWQNQLNRQYPSITNLKDNSITCSYERFRRAADSFLAFWVTEFTTL